MSRLVALAVVVMVSLSACGGSDEVDSSGTPAPSASPGEASAAPVDDAVVIEITLSDEGPSPRGDRVDVEVGEVVRLVVDNASSAADEVHVHSDPEHSLDVGPGATDQLEFTIDRPGQVAVESHHAGAVIVQLVVS